MTEPVRSYPLWEEWASKFTGVFDMRALKAAFEAGQRAGKPRPPLRGFGKSRREAFGRTTPKGNYE